jgi:hypothetical protein
VELGDLGNRWQRSWLISLKSEEPGRVKNPQDDSAPRSFDSEDAPIEFIMVASYDLAIRNCIQTARVREIRNSVALVSAYTHLRKPGRNLSAYAFHNETNAVFHRKAVQAIVLLQWLPCRRRCVAFSPKRSRR